LQWAKPVASKAAHLRTPEGRISHKTRLASGKVDAGLPTAQCIVWLASPPSGHRPQAWRKREYRVESNCLLPRFAIRVERAQLGLDSTEPNIGTDGILAAEELAARKSDGAEVSPAREQGQDSRAIRPSERVQMDVLLFERLLYEEESPTLDFKKHQYQFAKASDSDKSELLKDIIGFANAWRRSEAYILIGVEEVRGGRSNVIGIAEAEHLNDHTLQQFVNNLTNRPVRFHYEAFGFQGKQVGILRIDQQTRPIYLKRDYGKLRAQRVYIRRGTSTDPTKPASLEEIALMGQATFPASAELVVEFAHSTRDDSLGDVISWNAEYCQLPERNAIPDYPTVSHRTPWGLDLAVFESPLNRHNPDYYRELAHFEFAKRLFRPMRLVVRNKGAIVANNVRCELELLASRGVHVAYELPSSPKKRSALLSAVASAHIKPGFRRDPGEVTIDQNSDRYRIEIDCGDLQPGRRVWSEVFYLGKRDTGKLEVAGKLYAANLPEPKEFTLTVSVSITNINITISELLRIPEQRDRDD
jgi:hypothetical protein